MNEERGARGQEHPGYRRVAPWALALPALAIGTPLAAPFTWRYSPLATLGGMAVSHAAYCYTSLRANCRWCGPVVTHFVPEGDEVWLTIDDGPCPTDTPRMLDLLDAARARATFFVRGDRAQAHPDLIHEVLRRGHNVANHTYHHPQYSFWHASPWRVAAEIDRCNEVLSSLTSETPRWFRAPVGMANAFVHSAVEARGMRLIGWSNRGLDTLKSATPTSALKRILRGLRPGSIVLLHEGAQARIGERPNIVMLEMLLETLSDRRWRGIVPTELQLL